MLGEKNKNEKKLWEIKRMKKKDQLLKEVKTMKKKGEGWMKLVQKEKKEKEEKSERKQIWMANCGKRSKVFIFERRYQHVFVKNLAQTC